MQTTVLRNMSIPVRALLRTFAAQDHMDQWIAVSLVIVEKSSGYSLISSVRQRCAFLPKGLLNLR